MGTQKDIEIAEQEARDDLPKYKGWECIRCGAHPPYEELPVYWETKMCSWCHYQVLKDD